MVGKCRNSSSFIMVFQTEVSVLSDLTEQVQNSPILETSSNAVTGIKCNTDIYV